MDPHDQQAIADALLKLLTEKNLWNECRKNGWKNINLYSWPEHCRTYLTRVAACRMRHPQWQTDTPAALDEDPNNESLNDSLKDVQDTSLRLSIDGDKSTSINGSTENVQDQVKRYLSKIKAMESSDQRDSESSNSPGKFPALRRRKRFIVIAIDSYDESGNLDKKMSRILLEVMKAARLDAQAAKTTGFAISTALSVIEMVAFLKEVKVQVSEFDALICSSGGEVYYPSVNTEEEGKLYLDPDYASHIDYRWARDGLKKTIWKLMNTHEGEEEGDDTSSPIEDDEKSSNPHCVSYLIKDPSKVCTSKS